MKKVLIITVLMATLSCCNVGIHSLYSGKADEGAISFTMAESRLISVTIDSQTFQINSVKERALNTIYLSPGTHQLMVTVDGDEIYSKQIFISAGEHKIINL